MHYSPISTVTAALTGVLPRTDEADACTVRLNRDLAASIAILSVALCVSDAIAKGSDDMLSDVGMDIDARRRFAAPYARAVAVAAAL